VIGEVFPARAKRQIGDPEFFGFAMVVQIEFLKSGMDEHVKY